MARRGSNCADVEHGGEGFTAGEAIQRASGSFLDFFGDGVRVGLAAISTAWCRVMTFHIMKEVNRRG